MLCIPQNKSLDELSNELISKIVALFFIIERQFDIMYAVQLIVRKSIAIKLRIERWPHWYILGGYQI